MEQNNRKEVALEILDICEQNKKYSALSILSKIMVRCRDILAE